ncbi:MAG TPA: tetratricopeptide repeat protein [Micropepsaceae bacterium]|jgi:Flp pilus assembly protein TadD
MKAGYLLFASLLLAGCATTAHKADLAPPPHTDSAMALPAQAELYLGVVDGLIRQKRYEAAIAFLAKYQKTQAPTPRYNKLAGDALTGAGRFDEAITAYRQTLKSSFAPEAYNGIGRALSARGQWAEATENFRQAALLDPSNAGYLNNYAYAQLKQNFQGADLAPAVSVLQRAYELDPASPLIRTNLALALSLSGSRTQFLAFLGTIPDPAKRKQVADFSVAWKSNWTNDTGIKETMP